MRTSIKLTMVMLFCTAAPCWALAATDDLAQLRTVAEKKMTRQQQHSCLQDFAAKLPVRTPVTPAGDFAFNDAISRNVYNTLYWRNAEHGVAFTVPVHLSKDKVGQVACFYALTHNGMVLQQSQPVAAHWLQETEN
jgi:hypothetical protein